MKKLFILFSCLMAFIWSAHAVESTIFESFGNNGSTINTTTYWSPTLPTSYSTTAKAYTSQTTQIAYTVYNAMYTQYSSGYFLQLKNGSGYVEFSLPTNCTKIQLTNGNGGTASPEVKITLDSGTASSFTFSSDNSFTYTLPTDKTYSKIKILASGSALRIAALTYTIETKEVDPTDPTKSDAGLTFSKESETLNFVDKDSYSSPTLATADGFDGTVTYSSSADKVATVAADGTVTIVGSGTATITAESKATDNFNAGKATYTVTVNRIDHSDFKYAEASTSLNIDEIANFVQPTLNSDSRYDGTITYTSSKESVAIVDNSGAITLKGGAGTAIITATAPQTNGFNANTATYTIKVVDPNNLEATFDFTQIKALDNKSYTVDDITFTTTGSPYMDDDHIRIYKGETLTLSCNNDYKITNIVFEVTSTSYAGMSLASGEKGSLKLNSTTYTWTAGDDITTSVKFSTSGSQTRFKTITVSYTKDIRTPILKFAQETISVNVGATADAPALTEDSTEGLTLTYAVAEGSGDYIDVDATTGKITGKAVTTTPAVVNVTSAAFGKYLAGSASFNVTVVAANFVDAPTFAEDQKTDITTLDKVTLSCKMADATIMVVIDDKEAMAYPEGGFQLSAGEHTVYAYAVNGENRSANTETKTFTVSKVAAGIAWPASAVSIPYTSTDRSKLTLNNPNELTVSYTSSNTKVAEFNDDNTLKIKRPGTATLTATFDGNDLYEAATVTCELTATSQSEQELTAESLNVSTSGYGASTVTIGNATYSVYGYKTSNNIQFNYSANSRLCGIAVTNSPGEVVSMDIVIAAKTNAPLKVYGSNNPYTSYASLYNDDSKGELLKTIASNTSANTTITLSKEELKGYYYVGLMSESSGTIQMSKIIITYEIPVDTKCQNVTFSAENNGTIFVGESVKMNCNTAGSVVKFTINDGDEQTYDAANPPVFNTPGEYTIKAHGECEDIENGDETTLNFTVKHCDIASWIEVAGANKANTYTITSPVTVAYHNGQDMYVFDNTGYLQVLGDKESFAAYKAGDVLTGVSGTYNVYNGMTQMKSPTIASRVEGDAPEAVEMKVSEFNDYTKHAGLVGKYIKVKSLTVTSDNSTTFDAKDDEGNTILLWNRYNNTTNYDNVITAPVKGKRYDFVGIIYCYNSSTVSGYMELVIAENPVECPKDEVTLSWNGVKDDNTFAMTYGDGSTLPTLSVSNEAAASAVKYTSSNTNVATVDATGAVTVMQAGTTTITAAIDAANTYYTGNEVSYTLTVEKANVTLAWNGVNADNAIVMTYGDGTTMPTLSVSNEAAASAVKCTSSNTDVATVDAKGVVTVMQAGTTTITAAIDAANTCYAGNDVSYTLTVNKVPVTLAWNWDGKTAGNDTYTTTFTNDFIYVTLAKTDGLKDSDITLSIKNKAGDEGLIEFDEGKVLIGETDPDTYTVSATYAGNGFYESASATFTLVIEATVTTAEYFNSLTEQDNVVYNGKAEVIYRFNGNDDELWARETLADGSEYNMRIVINNDLMDNEVVKQIATGSNISGFTLSLLDIDKAGSDKRYLEAMMTAAPTSCEAISGYEYNVNILGDVALSSDHIGKGVVVKGHVASTTADKMTITSGNNTYVISKYFSRSASTAAIKRAQSSTGDWLWLATEDDWSTDAPTDKDVYVRGIVDKTSDGYVVYPTQMSTNSSYTTTDVRDLLNDSEYAVMGNSIIVGDGASVYTLSGVRVDGTNLASGVYVVRLANGSAVKVAIK
jgi:hypothetical protein